MEASKSNLFNSIGGITGAVLMLMFSQLLAPLSAQAEWQGVQDNWSIAVCTNYLAAGYGQGNLTHANHNYDDSISCDTDQVSFMITAQDAFYWGNR